MCGSFEQVYGEDGDASQAAEVPSVQPGAKEDTVRLANGDVVIAAITSCTNTSNPTVMLGAALLAKKAVDRGLKTKPWVKTSTAPGSRVVTEYLEGSGLIDSLNELGFHIVGYGCTTCIGNSGPLPQPISDAIEENDLAVVSVLSGNRSFEGRIHPQVKGVVSRLTSAGGRLCPGGHGAHRPEHGAVGRGP